MPQAIRRRCLLNGLVMTMSELKAGQVRIFQCESCGEVFDPSHQDSKAGWHPGVEVVADEHGDPAPSPFQCGPISERILADEARIRREAFEECAVMFDRDADEMEAVWNEFLASGSDGPGTSYHGIWRNIAAKIRALSEESPDA